MHLKGFINCYGSNLSHNFMEGTDSEVSFRENLLTQPDDWIYRTVEINYTYNSYGFRTVEFDSIDRDYILFTGCSLTEGVGLNIQHTYPYIVSKELNLPYINLALGGSDIGVLTHNLMIFLIQMRDKLPKYIFIQWPDLHRFHNFTSTGQVSLYNPTSAGDPLYKAMLEDEKFVNTNLFNRYALLEVLKSFEIENVYETDIYHPSPFSSSLKPKIINWVLFDKLDVARDLSHPGIKTHEKQAKEILASIV